MGKDAEADETLMQRARQGDAAALVEFATRWWGPIYRIALNMLGNASDAADATEQTFRLALRIPESIAFQGAFGISLRGAAIDLLLLRCAPSPQIEADSTASVLRRIERGALPASGGEDWPASTDEAFRRPDLPETLRRLLQRLDALDRTAFVLRELEKFSVDETVAILRMPAAEVRARVHRATLVMTGLLGRTLRHGSVAPVNP